MKFHTLFFDLDATLYSPANGLLKEINRRIQLYMRDRMGLPEEKVSELHRAYFQRYGATLYGLISHHQVDSRDYLAFVHDLPLAEYLQSDPALEEMLAALPQTLWVFTSASRAYTQRVLTLLGVENHFEGIISSEAVAHRVKPALKAYQTAMEIAGESDPRCCVMVDDRVENLTPAAGLGMTTVLINQDHTSEKVDHQADVIYELPDVFPELWNGGQ